MVKAFIVCAVAGLGNIPGTVFTAFTLALFEVAVQYLFGARYGFPRCWYWSSSPSSGALTDIRSEGSQARMNNLRKPTVRDIIIGVAALIVAAIIPFLEPGRYTLLQITLFFIWAMVVTQWNLVFGVAGIFSLAQMTVFAVARMPLRCRSLSSYQPLDRISDRGVCRSSLQRASGRCDFRFQGAIRGVAHVGNHSWCLPIDRDGCGLFLYKGETCYTFTGGMRAIGEFGDFGFRNRFGYKHELLPGIIGTYPIGLRSHLCFRHNP